jgi:hypothetical protein
MSKECDTHAEGESGVSRARDDRRPGSAPEFDVMHLIRIKGSVSDADLAGAAPAAVLDGLVGAGLVRATTRGYVLLPAGLVCHAHALEAERAGTDLARIASAYRRFLAVNGPVKAACTSWQTSTAGVEELLVTVDVLDRYFGRVKTALARAGEVLPRFHGYAKRLDAAATRAREGDRRFVTDLAVPSFHSVWFECHEDFLLTLDLRREDEEHAPS